MTAQLGRNFRKAQSPHGAALKQTAGQKGDSRLHLRPRPACICTRFTETDSEPTNKMKQPRHADTCWYLILYACELLSDTIFTYIYKFRVQGHNGARKEWKITNSTLDKNWDLDPKCEENGDSSIAICNHKRTKTTLVRHTLSQFES